MDRNELARRARAQTEARRAELRVGGRRRRIPRYRLAIWAVELGILLGALEFVVRRRGHGDRGPTDEIRVHETGMLPAPKPTGPMVELAGSAAVPGALLAATDALAAGSEAMRNAQVTYSRTSGLPIEIENSVGMRFRLVPPGSSVIGSPPDERGRGVVEPRHVQIVYRPFYLGKFEVTQAEFAKVTGRYPSGFRGPRRPVEEITWYDAQKFCIALNEREGLPKNTYRLPTEVEWEYACRREPPPPTTRATAAPTATAWPRTADTNYQSTANVGGRPPNALGLYNMHGNVWEWCLDYYTRYPGDDTPITDDEKRMRCLRGGNWRVPIEDCRSAERGRLTATSHGNVLGFRVLRTVPERKDGQGEDIMPLDSLP